MYDHIAHNAHSTRAPRFLPSGLWVMWVIENKVENRLLN